MEAMEQLLRTPTLTTFYPNPTEMDLPSKQQRRLPPPAVGKWGKYRKTTQASFGKRKMSSGRCAACGRGLWLNNERSGRLCHQCSNDFERGRWNQKHHIQQKRTFYNGQYHHAAVQVGKRSRSRIWHAPAIPFILRVVAPG
jgi:hypothetical protein